VPIAPYNDAIFAAHSTCCGYKSRTGLRELSIMRDAEASNLRCAMLALAAAMLSSAAGAQPQGWSVYGGDAAGTRYSTATEITKANVAELRVVPVTRHGTVHPSPAVPWK
jgi:glucose dehydrogenase